jgi:hypothetical protein
LAEPCFPLPKEIPMITLSNSQLWVRDQDEALAFYT